MPSHVSTAQFGAGYTQIGGGLTSCVNSVNVGSGANRCLIVKHFRRADRAIAVQSVTIGGESMVVLGSDVLLVGSNYVRTFVLVNPTVEGAQDLIITCTTNGNNSVGLTVVGVFADVDPSAVEAEILAVVVGPTVVSTTPWSDPYSLTVPSASGHLAVLEAFTYSDDVSYILTASGFDERINGGGGGIFYQGGDKAGEASAVFTWTPTFLSQNLTAVAHGYSLPPVVGGTTHDLAGAAAAAAQAAASLAITKALAASSTGGVAVGAAIAHGVPLAGQSTVGVGSTADLQTIGDASLAGAASVGASAQSAIALIVPLGGAATGAASGSAALAHIVTLAGAAVSAVGAAAGVTHGVPLAGAASAGAVTSDGTLLVAITLQGDAVLGALGSANLDTVGDGSLSGAAAGGVAAQAQLALDLRLGGAAFGGVQGATTIGLTVPLAAAAVAAAQADGLLTVVVGLAGVSSGRVTSIAALGVSVELGGQAAIGIGVNAAFPSSGAAIVRAEFAALRMRSLAIELRARHADFRLT